jgi:hypothetical protein
MLDHKQVSQKNYMNGFVLCAIIKVEGFMCLKSKNFGIGALVAFEFGKIVLTKQVPLALTQVENLRCYNATLSYTIHVLMYTDLRKGKSRSYHR